MVKGELQVGDVVQLTQASEISFQGCFMIVTETMEWGAQGFVFVPGKRDEAPGRAFFRAKFEAMELIGKAALR